MSEYAMWKNQEGQLQSLMQASTESANIIIESTTKGFNKFTELYGLVDKLKKNGFLYGILIIPIAGGHFYDGKTKRTNPDGNP